jgi:hypothetical protein
LEKTEGVNIFGIRSLNYAGCVLTYAYFNGIASETSIDANHTIGMHIDEIPLAVLLVGDRDTWKYEHGEVTNEFFAGFYYLEDSKPDSPAWDNAMENVGFYIARGADANKVADKIFGDQVERAGFWVDWMGYKCFCVNSASAGSRALELAQPDADIYISFRWANGMFSVSLYTHKPNIDVSKIAKMYRWDGGDGGGHVGAAGFQCSFPPFLLR